MVRVVQERAWVWITPPQTPHHLVAVSGGDGWKPLVRGLIPAEYEHLLILSCRRWQSLQACVSDCQEPGNKCHLK